MTTDPTQIDVAEQHIQEGINLLEELGTVAESCLGYLWLGEVYAEAGRTEDALGPMIKAEAIVPRDGHGLLAGICADSRGKAVK